MCFVLNGKDKYTGEKADLKTVWEQKKKKAKLIG